MYHQSCAHDNIKIKTVSLNNKNGNAGRKYEICLDCDKFIRFRPEQVQITGQGNDVMATEAHDLTTGNTRPAPSTQTPHREALTKIINQFTATHVFIRLGGGINIKEEQVWETVFQKNHPDCVFSIAELIEVKRTNYSLYESSRQRYVDELECLYREHDEKYPKKIYISYTPPTPKLNWRERLNRIGGNSITANSATPPELAEQANLSYFNGNFYAKTPNGCPIESVRYNLKELNCFNKDSDRPNVNEAIVALANAILNT